MKTNNLLFSGIRLLSMLTVLFLLFAVDFACRKENCPNLLSYEIPYSIYPKNDTFQIGDTIWMDIEFNDLLVDLNGQIKNKFVDYDFRLELNCGKFDVEPTTTNTIAYLEAAAEIGGVQSESFSSSSLYNILPIYDNNTYRFRSGFILKEKGSFLLSIWPFEWEDVHFEVNGQCENSNVEIHTRLNSGVAEENNYYLLKSSPNEYYKNMTVERFGIASYCFVVR